MRDGTRSVQCRYGIIYFSAFQHGSRTNSERGGTCPALKSEYNAKNVEVKLDNEQRAVLRCKCWEQNHIKRAEENIRKYFLSPSPRINI